jgi:tetratricopeptide (TPR) repeat protein
MNQRLTRKEIKRDEFATAVGRSVEYAETHTRGLAYAIAGAVLLALVALGAYAWLNRRGAAGDEELAYAMKVYAAPVVPAAAKPDDRREPSFLTEEARRARAKTLFEQVRSRYSHTDAADVAAVYLGQIAVAEGRLDEARKLWSEFLDRHEKHVLGGETRLNLIRLDRQQGKGEEVIGRLRPMLDDPEAPLPQDVVLFELGKTYEELNRRSEAAASYRRIADEFPQSAYRQEAQTRLLELDPARALSSPAAGAGLGF